MDEDAFLLEDRLQKIRAMASEHDFSANAYLSFSGGKDSTVLHYLLDEALPGNSIPRVYINTGIEYRAVLDYVRMHASVDPRVKIINSGVNIPAMLKEYGYPIASKEHSHKLHIYQNSGETETVRKYLAPRGSSRFVCSKILRYQFTPGFTLRGHDICCTKLKKQVIARWQKQNARPITITGMRRLEGGQRRTLGCAVFHGSSLAKFHPLAPVSDEWLAWYTAERNIKFCTVYYQPYSFYRTGCKGCPFAMDIRAELDKLRLYFPAEWVQCWNLWGDVYREYARIGYRNMKGIEMPQK